MTTSDVEISTTTSKSTNLPYPLSQLANNPRCKFRDGEIAHYIFFWTCAGTIAGVGVGVLSFYRQYRYLKWVRKQPIETQLKLLEKNNIIASAGGESPGIATTRFSTLPKAMDTRMKLPYSSDYRPYQWYEFGPLKLWNNLGNYPWASLGFTEIGKWSIRLSLLCGTTLAFESLLCLSFGYPLGTNPYIRGISGYCTGYFVAKIASEGILFWYQTLGIAIGLGSLWAGATLYNSKWGEIARDNVFVIEMYSKTIHYSVKKHYDAKKISKELAAKDRQEKREIYNEFLQFREDELGGKSGQVIENVDLAAAATIPKEMEDHWLMKYIFRRNKNIKVSKEIDEMPYEQRKQLEQKVLGDRIAVNFRKYPLKLIAKQQPQFYSMDKDRITNESDTAKLVNTIKDDETEPNPFHQDNHNLTDLRILN